MHKTQQNVPDPDLSHQIKSTDIWDSDIVVKVLGKSIVKVPENEVTWDWEQENEEEVDDDPHSKSLMTCINSEEPLELKEGQIRGNL